MKAKERDKLLKRIAKLERENAELRRGQGKWVNKGDLIGHAGNTGALIASGGWGTGPNSPQPDDPSKIYAEATPIGEPWEGEYDGTSLIAGVRELFKEPGVACSCDFTPIHSEPLSPTVRRDNPHCLIHHPISQTSDPVWSALQRGTEYTIQNDGTAEIQMPGGGVLIMPAEMLKDINIIHFDEGDNHGGTGN